MNRFLPGIAITLCVLSAATPQWGRAQSRGGVLHYRAVDLGGRDASPQSLNGDVAVGWSRVGDDPNTFYDGACVWRHGKPMALPSLAANRTTGATGINGRGLVVGLAVDGGYKVKPAMWRDGKLTVLRLLPPYDMGAAISVNDAGTIVGQIGMKNEVHAVVWSGGAPERLPNVAAYSNSVAFAINGSGVIAGWCRDDRRSRAVEWIARRAVPLPGLGGYGNSMAHGINARGMVVGQAYGGPQDQEGTTGHAVLWKNGRVVDLGTLGGDFSEASGINDKEYVVGDSKFAGSGTKAHAFVWHSGVMTDLNSITTFSGAKAVLDSAPHIDNRGEIVASGLIGRVRHGYILIPTASNRDRAPHHNDTHFSLEFPDPRIQARSCGHRAAGSLQRGGGQ